MSVWAIFRVKDEADIIASTVWRMGQQVDHVVVADNGSTDGTREIVRQFDVELWDDVTVGYYQSAIITSYAREAARRGATWVISADADEVWRARSEGPPRTITEALEELPEHVVLAEASVWDHVATGIDDPADDDPVRRMRWRRAQPTPMRKVACRARPDLTITQGNHSARYEGIRHPAAVLDALTVRHFPYRSPEQFIRKVKNGAAAYGATDLPEDVGAHWRQYGRLLEQGGEKALEEVFSKWFYREDPRAGVNIEGEQQGPLVLDPVR